MTTQRTRALAGLVCAGAVFLTACGGGDSADDTGSGSTAQKVASCGLSGGSLRIMPLGDSITEAEAGHNSYRRVLWQRLNGAGCSANLVGSKSGVSRGSRDSGSTQPPNADFDTDHEGYWDYAVNELTPRVSGLVGQAQPDIVLVHMGTNDILRGQSPSGVAQELGGLVDAIRAGKADTYILLAKIIPANAHASDIAALNNLLDSVAAGRSSASSPVIVVNQASGYSVGDNYDGVHPNPNGEAKLGNRWADTVLGLRSQ